MKLSEYLQESKRAFSDLESHEPFIKSLSEEVFELISKGGSIYWIGNGGSAADAQHLSCELVSRFTQTRKPIKSVALTTNTSLITAISNDYGFEDIFYRQVEAFVNDLDILVCISTSGESLNILRAATLARSKGALIVAFTNENSNSLSKLAHYSYHAPTSITGIVQQCHITIGQAMCLELEEMTLRENEH